MYEQNLTYLLRLLPKILNPVGGKEKTARQSRRLLRVVRYCNTVETTRKHPFFPNRLFEVRRPTMLPILWKFVG